MYMFMILKLGADGFKSLLRETAGIHTIKWEYGQLGVVTTVQVAEVSASKISIPLYTPQECFIIKFMLP